ncbi:MAG: PKD domain-containing protein, partial [Bacteroidota bacterium]
SFGDGGTATGAYPSHFYSAPGTYGVCVTMASTTSNGFTCTDTFCDSITIDSTGFLVFKNQAGFTLQVIDASQLTSIEYPELALHVLPNPAARGTRLTWASNAAVERVELSDLQGRVLCTGTAHLDTEGLPAGTYVLQATTPWGPVSQRVVLVP